MLECWDSDPERRPSFTMIASTISEALQIMSGYLELSAAADTVKVLAKLDESRQPILVRISFGLFGTCAHCYICVSVTLSWSTFHLAALDLEGSTHQYDGEVAYDVVIVWTK